MISVRQTICASIVGFALCSCASAPKFDTTGVDMSITPERAAAESAALASQRLLWGGMIISSGNLKDATELEVLAYPLSADQRPDTNQTPVGRFLAVHAGYLETADYAPDRRVTLSGTLDGNRRGRIGEADYVYSVLRIDKIHLWPQQGHSAEPTVRFGFGFSIHK